MQNKDRMHVSDYTKRRHRRSVWRKIVRTMACVVVFCTTYALILPAITMGQDYHCGIEAHVHGPECYVEKALTELICPPEKTPAHVHTHACYGADGGMQCGSQNQVLHTHDAYCLDAEHHLICVLPEVEEHVHTEACYSTVGHAHTDACYETVKTLVCTVAEQPTEPEVTEPEATEPETTEPEVTEPKATEPEITEPTPTEPETAELPVPLEPITQPEPIIEVPQEPVAGQQSSGSLAADAGHTHGDGCYQTEQVLTCGLEEAPVTTELTCTKPEVRSHTHTADCYDASGANVCGLPQTVAHRHTQECVSVTHVKELTCTLPEHTHDEHCKSDPNADLETAEQWEQTMARVTLTGNWADDLTAIAKTQLGYTESTRNYVSQEDGSAKGYTRYGAWYGVPYGTWDAMFASFCLHYANIPAEAIPRESNTGRWFEALRGLNLIDGADAALAVGDLVFGADANGSVSRVAIVTAVETDADGSVRMQIIEGDLENQVVQSRVAPQQFGLLGRCSMEKARARYEAMLTGVPLEEAPQTLSQTAETENYIVTVSYSAELLLPAGAELRVVEYARDSEAFRQRCAEAGYELEWLLNIGFYLNDMELDLDGQFDVVVTSRQGESLGSDIAHFAQEGTEYITGETGDGETSVSFSSGGFSDFGGGVAPLAEGTVPGYPHHPHAVHTGDVHISRLRFYNICENGDNGVTALAGCVFEVRDSGGNLVATVVSGNDPEVNLPALADGTYTITEVSVPEGYLRDTNYQRTFEVKNGILVSDRNIGTFINHDIEQINANKTGEVEDYNNRIYQILLDAESHIRMYQMDPIDVLFVVDQSNSMLFPAGLYATGKTVTLRNDGVNNTRNMENLGLDKTQMYYLISDPQGTSTVWCLWYDGEGWLYQDASYYAKAKHGNVDGYQTPGETAIFPRNRSYDDQKNSEASGTRSNGGGIGFAMGTQGGLGKYINTMGGSHTFQIYQATSEYNRLHYVEESLANMIYELADINSENSVTLTLFTKEVLTEDCTGQVKLTPANTEMLVDMVTSINTSGGTRQDLALEHVYNEHLNNSGQHYHDATHTYTILVTDGAPVRSGSDAPSLGGPDDAPSTAANGTIYARIKGFAELVRTKSTLMTVALGMESVEAGRQVLEDIASGDDFYCALDDAAELVKTMQRLLFNSFRPKESITLYGDVTDEISDSFYPIAWVAYGAGAATGRQVLVTDSDQDWILLQENDWITVEGQYTTAGAADAAGQLLKKSDGTYYIHWKNVQLSDPYASYDPTDLAWVEAGQGAGSGRTVIAADVDGKDWIMLQEGDWITREGEYYAGTPGDWQKAYCGQYLEGAIVWGRGANSGASRVYFTGTDYGWHGTFYVKAKEDFIGGNAIETNKMAYVTSDHSNRYFDTPTVNVRLLGLNEFESEVTVYLGDIVNEVGHAPLDSLQGFWEDIVFTKLIADGGDVLNKVTAASSATDGLEEAVFYLRYALGQDLTADQWNTLVSGGTLTIPYTYDDPSSNGPVGEFTISLTKTGIAGAAPDYAEHEATAACQPNGQPLTENCTTPAETYTLTVNYTAYRLGENGRPAANVHNGSGSPGTEVGTGTTLETGLGTVISENVHDVHVISGAIRISKIITDALVSETAQTYTFTLHRVEDGDDTTSDVTKTITVPAGTKAGELAITFDGLRRGTYKVTEAANDLYHVESITVLASTNCESNPAIGLAAAEVTFVMGNNIAGANVITKPAGAAYTSYTDPVNGVFGEAVFTNDETVYEAEIPVAKSWSDGVENHPGDSVYVVLYLDGAPVLDGDGRARLLRLDAANNWTDSFTVPLKDKNDVLTNYNYTVYEVSKVSATELYGWQSAVLENDGTTVVYYEKIAQAGALIAVDSRGYVVSYGVGADGTWLITNERAVDLPMTGGIGTTFYHTFGMLLILAAALMYIRNHGCNRRKEGRR